MSSRRLARVYEDFIASEYLKAQPVPDMTKVNSFYPFRWIPEGRSGQAVTRLIDADEGLRFRLEFPGMKCRVERKGCALDRKLNFIWIKPMHFFLGRLDLLTPLLTAALVGVAGLALCADGEIVISQKNKQFQPGRITIDKGQPMVISNDDGGTVHHAYVETDGFNFDSGDQKPGSRTRIVFPTKGDYQVLCGIHPDMKLDVRVK